MQVVCPEGWRRSGRICFVATRGGSSFRIVMGGAGGRLGESLLDLAGLGPESRVLLLGLGGLSLGCALVRGGVAHVETAGLGDGDVPGCGSADLAIVPLAINAGVIEAAIRIALRALPIGGTLVLGAVPPRMAELARDGLWGAGFGWVHSWRDVRGSVVRVAPCA